jgi:hypothetical protein
MYFHLLFAVAIAALAIAIHQPVLLAVVVLIDLEIVYQFLPTARLDGYWTIADALGVPDPISQARLQVAPVGRQRGARAAAVRPRAAAALGAYLLTSLLLMAAVLALTIVDLPQIVRKAAGIFHRNAHVFGQAFGRGDVLVAAAVSVQLVLLALILVAVCLMVYRSSHSAVRVLAGWSRSNRRRRSITLACATTILAATALLWSRGFFWAPHLPLMPGQGAAAPIGTRTFAVASSGPVAGTITYDVHPAVGGPYAKQWQTCGFYTTPVVESRAVHSLARGAVWIAYRPTLAGPERALLHAVTEQLRFVLAAPYSGLRSPFVLTAWKHQLALHSLADPRFAQFIAAFRLSRQAPEHGRPCKGGVGAPAR